MVKGTRGDKREITLSLAGRTGRDCVVGPKTMIGVNSCRVNVEDWAHYFVINI